MPELAAFPPRRRPVPEDLRGVASTIARALEPHPEVAAGYLFGSVARGEHRPESDLDVGIVFMQRGDTARDHLDALAEMAARLEGTAGRRDVDLIVLESQGPIFCHRVLSEGVLVYERDAERRVDFESDTIVRALDFRPTYDRALRGQVEGFRRWLKKRHDPR